MIGQAERLIELGHLENRDNDRHSLKKVITFSSGKGGTGKTFLSLNTGFALSRLNKRILFLDLDFNFANTHLLLNIIPEATINDFFLRKKLFGDLIHKYSSNLHFVFGGSGDADFPDLSSKDLKILIDSLSRILPNYDFIIIDTGSGGHKIQINLISYAGVNVIVAQTEPTAVMDAYVMVKLLSTSKFRGMNYVLINKCTDEDEADFAFNSIKTASGHFLGKTVGYLGTINSDPMAIKSINSQELLVEKYPNHSLSRQISKAAWILSDITQVANIKQ